ncbi:glycosyltransferase [Methylococcus geothermalis]|uniref:Glycosyltransferase n=1 Tax=Methylococcus geothermalis TaxID=2681310 RepID=A0A858Q5E3_9GAMM|nr:glycosyltransferase [Methylococcus geothermalis]QJD29024.1 glycosyltransferase [Methylococcus geothermalis]
MDTAYPVFGGLVFISAALWTLILVLPWFPWLNREVLRLSPGGHVPDLGDVTVVIPARDEAEVIGQTLAALKEQGAGLRIVLVDDGSTDGTEDAARRVEGLDLTVLRNDSLPPGWSGKLWALEQGVAKVVTEYTVLLDADIVLRPGVLGTLREKMRSEGIPFASLMASLRMANFWEKLLMPAFVYFFKMLYPFALANSPDRRFAAAAGGCIMLETRLLERIGGFSAIHGALIDDCTLAKKVKATGARTWIGLSRAVVSLRRYDTLADVWDMVARTAFTQLRYSAWLLAVCTLLMLILFWLPAACLFASDPAVMLAAVWAVVAMTGSYAPTLRFYGRSLGWGLLMPVIAAAYLAMTWSSALRYWHGERSRWKGRVYRSEDDAR